MVYSHSKNSNSQFANSHADMDADLFYAADQKLWNYERIFYAVQY